MFNVQSAIKYVLFNVLIIFNIHVLHIQRAKQQVRVRRIPSLDRLERRDRLSLHGPGKEQAAHQRRPRLSGGDSFPNERN